MDLFTASGVQMESEKTAQIPERFITIKNAKGLPIFSAIRVGMYLAGSGGSGIVVARLPDGTWAPLSAFSVRSGSIGLVCGIVVYDCMCVLNMEAAVESYSKPEMKFDGAVAFAAGPVGGSAIMKDVKPIWTYTKSRGLYGGVTVDGTSIKEKSEINAEFYGVKVTAADIWRGAVQGQERSSKSPAGAKQLIEVLKLAERKGADRKILERSALSQHLEIWRSRDWMFNRSGG